MHRKQSEKFRFVFVALIPVLVLGALSAESASAVTFLLALWLANGVAVTTALNVEGEGEGLLEDTKGGLFGEAVSILCSSLGDGTVDPESLGVISEVLTLSGVAVSTTPLSGEGLKCTNVASCSEPRVWPIGLPYDLEVELVEDGTEIFFAVLILPHAGSTNIGWLTQCKGIIGEPEDECTQTEGAGQLTLEGATLLASASSAFLELIGQSLPANCTRGGTGSGLVESDVSAPIKLVGGGELSASSEASEA
jgi:hypothetical protein